MAFSDMDALLGVVDSVFGEELPAPFDRVRAARQVLAGADVKVVAKSVRTNAKSLQALVDAPDLAEAAFARSLSAPVEEKFVKRARTALGQLLIGTLAERAFETMYKTRVGTTELRLEDDRESRSDTDYLVRNGSDRKVFRMNIKFHGARFRNAQEMVGLDPEDCFALATYKIKQALQKQDKEVLPYIFVIVGVPHLSGEVVGAALPADLVDLMAFVFASEVPKKRDIEDRIVQHVIANTTDAALVANVSDFAERIGAAEWRVLSARKADLLLRKLLFERVFAVRVRGFAKNYRNAELDMHYSITGDLTKLDEFLDLLKTKGLHGLAGHLERGLL